MKVKNFFQFICLTLMGILSTAFIQPTPVLEANIPTGTEANFAEFLSHFKKVELPFSMNLEDFEQYKNYKKSNSKRKSKKKKGNNSQAAIYSEFLPQMPRVMFRRSGGPRRYPVARFYPNEKMVAVVYCTKEKFVGDILQIYNLAVYNLKGELLFPKNTTNQLKSDVASQKQALDYNLVSSEFNIGSSSFQQTITFKVDEKGNIWKNTYENIWKQNVKKKGYHHNQLVDFKIKDTQVFQLNEKGFVETLKAIPAEGRASLN